MSGANGIAGGVHDLSRRVRSQQRQWAYEYEIYHCIDINENNLLEYVVTIGTIRDGSFRVYKDHSNPFERSDMTITEFNGNGFFPSSFRVVGKNKQRAEQNVYINTR